MNIPTAPSPPVVRRWIGATLLAAWVLVDVAMVAIAMGHAWYVQIYGRSTSALDNDFWTASILGTLFAQLTLGGMWTVFGPGALSVRLPVTLAGIGMAAVSFFRVAQDGQRIELPLMVVFGGLFAALVFATMGAFYVVHRWTGIIARWRDEAVALRTMTQFRLLDIVFWTAGVGISITIVRWVFRETILELHGFTFDWRRDAPILVILITGAVTTALWAAAAALRSCDGAAWLLHAVGFGAVTCVWPALFALTEWMNATSTDYAEGVVTMFILFVGEYVLLSANLLLLRLAGVELVRLERKQAAR